jgi:hypothetical protein
MLRPTAWVSALLVAFLLSCKSEEDKTREKVVGEYVSEFRGDGYYVKDVLTLRPSGTWIKTRDILTTRGHQAGSPDSGTYRITGVTLNLRSLVQSGIVLVRYTILGDTLFGADAAEAKKFTGTDIGEEMLVRMR